MAKVVKISITKEYEVTEDFIKAYNEKVEEYQEYEEPIPTFNEFLSGIIEECGTDDEELEAWGLSVINEDTDFSIYEIERGW